MAKATAIIAPRRPPARDHIEDFRRGGGVNNERRPDGTDCSPSRYFCQKKNAVSRRTPKIRRAIISRVEIQIRTEMQSGVIQGVLHF